MPTWITLALLLALVASPPAAKATDAEPKLTIRSGNQVRTFTRAELLHRADTTQLSVAHDPAYDDQARDYSHVVPLRPLFEGVDVPRGSVLQFECLDGFSAPLSKERLLGEGTKPGAIPYIAVEAPGEKWAPVGGKKDPGPFYLVWKNPEKSKIGREEWPFALAGFTVKESLESTFPKIFPAKGTPVGSPVDRGFQAFAKNCFACHTINLEGQSRMGPDLNVPMNPTEYLSEANLKKLVRNPQNLRSWPQAKMTGFSASALPDKELGDLVAYLKHMAKNKVPLPEPTPASR